MSKYYRFWMVYAEGGGAPARKHFFRDEAEAEAERLAVKNGRPVYVLESKGGYDIPEPKVTTFSTHETAPEVARHK